MTTDVPAQPVHCVRFITDHGTRRVYMQTAYDLPTKGLRGLDCFSTKDLEIDTAKASAKGIFAAQSQDRCGDVLEISGIVTALHRKNPIVGWLHFIDRQQDANMPIGVTEDEEGNYTVKLLPDQGIAVCTTYFTQK